MAGTITLRESNNETRIEWKINHFFIREDNLIISPDFILFKSNWFLQLHLGSTFLKPFSNTKDDYWDPLCMSLLTLNPTTEYHIEYRMGIQVCNGSEITTEKFESVLNKGFCQTPQRRELISRKDFESSRNSLVTEDTLTVLCTVRLISALNPDMDVSSPIHPTDGDFLSSCLLFCNEEKITGEITLDESKNETRIEWRINDFLNKQDYWLNSPHFLIFNSKFLLQIQNVNQFVKSFFLPGRDSLLTMCPQILYTEAELYIEFEMGIQMSNGTEVRTGKFESLLQHSKTLQNRKIISRKDLESAGDILDSENTLRIFCTMSLLSDDKTNGGIKLLDNFDFDRYWYCSGTRVGEISLYRSENETRIEWTINHFFTIDDNLMKSPKFILFKSNWRLQIDKNDCFPLVIENVNVSSKFLAMRLNRDFHSMAEHYIEYRMGINKPDGSEITTKKFESVIQPRFRKILPARELLSANDLKRLRHTLTHGKSLKVFCIVRLLNDDNPVKDIQPATSSRYGAGASYENPKSVSPTKGIFTLNINAKDVHIPKRNSTLNTNDEDSGFTKGIFKFGSGASHENSKSVCPSESIRTLSEKFQDLHKNISTQTENSEIPWLPNFFNFGETFKDTGTSSESSKDVCLSKGIRTLSENLEHSYLSKRFTDITIKVKGREFLAHKTILSIRSEVFASMFEHDTSEKRSQVIDITDCDPDSFENFLLYLYSGKLDTVSSSNATSLFKIADKYGVGELKSECVRCMSREMTVDSFCDIFYLAFLYGEFDLLDTATNFFIPNASAILITKEWLTLLEEHTSLCNELLVKLAKSSSELSSRQNRLIPRNPRDHRVSARRNENTF